MQANETGYVIAGTSGVDSITISSALTGIKGAVVFAKGGGDTIYINIASAGLTLIGGITGTDNTDTDNHHDLFLYAFIREAVRPWSA